MITNDELAKLIDLLEYPYQEWVTTWFTQRISLTTTEQENRIKALILLAENLRTAKQTAIIAYAGKQVDDVYRFFQGQIKSDTDNEIRSIQIRLSILLDIPFNKNTGYLNS
jgi:hypothetical protein